MATKRDAAFAVVAAAALLLWPALWNGYPIVFADSGTYLSQAVHRYAGWDRPVFYSLFILPLHWTVILWPVVVAQAVLTAWVLWITCRTLTPGLPPLGFVVGIAVLAFGTWLPWIVSELMPDILTPLLILVICLLCWMPEHLSSAERAVLTGLAALMIASQQSSLPLAIGLSCILWAARWFLRGAAFPWPLVVAPSVALLAMCSMNFAAHGRFSVSPFGNVFLLARVIYDGPGMNILDTECASRRWRLCQFRGSFPLTSDDFLWTDSSPLSRAGGPKVVSAEADSIIRSAVGAQPVAEARAMLRNSTEQLTRFSSGDGLNAWPAQVSPWIQHDFPAREAAAYAAARQQTGTLAVPDLLAWLHSAAALAGVAVSLALLPRALRRRDPRAGLLLGVLLALPLCAAITGALSAPHDRYQSRIMWLPPFAAAISLPSPRRPALASIRRPAT